jgi:hypothetical protein
MEGSVLSFLKAEVSMVAKFVNDQDEMSTLYRGPSIDASYKVSVHLAKRFQRRRFLKIGQSETRIACGGHVNFNVCMFLSLFIDSGKIPPSSFTNVFFLAHLAKGNVNFCHHLSSVVRYFSPFNLLL